MPTQDPVHNVTLHNNVSAHVENFISLLRSAALSSGWLVSEYDTVPALGSQNGGDELYLRSNDASFSEHTFVSFKAHMGQGSDHTALGVYLNTGYNPLFRVDNQPGMYARHQNDIVNAAAWSQIFSGLWDNGGVNADVIDPGKYLTPGGAVPTIAVTVPHFNFRNGTNFDKLWFIADQTARMLAAIWYIDNQMYGLVFGKVYYDNEGVSPSNQDGSILAGWCHRFDQKATLLPPVNNSLGGERTDITTNMNPFALIRNRTQGAFTFPPGTPNGNPFFGCGTVVKSFDKIEASDGVNQPNSSSQHRPDQSFDTTVNGLQFGIFPNPRLTIHYEALTGSQHRRALCRHRRIARYPTGGALTGNFLAGQGVSNWADAGYFFPWYFAPTAGLQPGDIVTEGTRRYMVFPGNRGGIDPFASHRYAGIAFRMTDV